MIGRSKQRIFQTEFELVRRSFHNVNALSMYGYCGKESSQVETVAGCNLMSGHMYHYQRTSDIGFGRSCAMMCGVEFSNVRLLVTNGWHVQAIRLPVSHVDSFNVYNCVNSDRAIRSFCVYYGGVCSVARFVSSIVCLVTLLLSTL